MDFIENIQNAIKVQRQKTLSEFNQLTLGEIILKVEPLVDKYKDDDNIPLVSYDFEYLYPTTIDSWRGSYDELALNFEGVGDGNPQLNIVQFYELLKDTIGKEFTGYKGGEYIMTKHTPVWVANYGNSGNTAVVDILDNEYEIIIITQRCVF